MLKRLSTLLVAIAGVGMCLPAAAQLDDERFYVAPSFSYSIADADRLSSNGLGAQIGIGRQLNQALAVELTGFFNRFSGDFSDQTGEFKGIGIGANMFPISDRPDFFLRGALHYGRTSDQPCNVQPGFTSCRQNYDSIVFDVGAGALLRPRLLQFINEGTALRLEAVYRMDSHEEGSAGRGRSSAFYDGVFSVGLQIPIGRLMPEEEPEEVRVVEAERPQCPDYPDLRIPEDEPVDARGCPPDSDGDGVPDFLDQCPGTPPGTPVDEVGCPLPLSQCRPPFPGEEVDRRGCATDDTVVLRGVTFEFDSDRITPDARVILDGVADTMVAEPGIIVEIGGHTDSLGSAAYNKRLSERRANSVRDYLLRRGVAARQLEARGYGEEQPIADNDTEDGRELNRRVELRILALED